MLQITHVAVYILVCPDSTFILYYIHVVTVCGQSFVTWCNRLKLNITQTKELVVDYNSLNMEDLCVSKIQMDPNNYFFHPIYSVN